MAEKNWKDARRRLKDKTSSELQQDIRTAKQNLRQGLPLGEVISARFKLQASQWELYQRKGAAAVPTKGSEFYVTFWVSDVHPSSDLALLQGARMRVPGWAYDFRAEVAEIDFGEPSELP